MEGHINDTGLPLVMKNTERFRNATTSTTIMNHESTFEEVKGGVSGGVCSRFDIFFIVEKSIV